MGDKYIHFYFQVGLCSGCGREKEDGVACGCGGTEVSWQLRAEGIMSGQRVVLGDLVVRRTLGLPLGCSFRHWVQLTGKVVPAFVAVVLQSGTVWDVSGTGRVGTGVRVVGAEEPGLDPELDLGQLEELERLHSQELEEPRVELELEQPRVEPELELDPAALELDPAALELDPAALEPMVQAVRVDLTATDRVNAQRLGDLWLVTRREDASPDVTGSEIDLELEEVQKPVRGPTVASMYDRKSGRCTECNLYVKKKLQLPHLKAEHGWEPFQCGACDFMCAREDHLADHFARRHGAGGPRVDCPECGMNVARQALVPHIASKHGGRVSLVGVFRFCGPSGTLAAECNCTAGTVDLLGLAKNLERKFPAR